MNLLRVSGTSGVMALVPDVSVASILAGLGVLLLSVGLLLGSAPARRMM